MEDLKILNPHDKRMVYTASNVPGQNPNSKRYQG